MPGHVSSGSQLADTLHGILLVHGALNLEPRVQSKVICFFLSFFLSFFFFFFFFPLFLVIYVVGKPEDKEVHISADEGRRVRLFVRWLLNIPEAC